MSRDIFHSSTFLLLLALTLSSFTFLWNPLGFPPLKYEDGTYIGRALHVLTARTPQEGTFYDHPYFGQLLLAAILWLTGYPVSVHPSAQGNVLMSVVALWIVPKIIIGMLGILDTFLVFKISERRYNAKVGFIASILFAIMSISYLRTVYLESLQLPLLLSSILFALYASPKTNGKGCKILTCVLISGIFMGLAIFTKIPVFVMIPMVIFLILENKSKKIKITLLWIIPVILIPSIWPVYAILHSEFDYWLGGIYWQTHRQSSDTALESDKQVTFANSVTKDFLKMPLMFALGISGLVFAALKKDYFLLLWSIPFLGFLYFIGFASEYHIIPLLPLIFISSSRLIVGLCEMITYRKIGEVLPFFIIFAIAIFGLINVTIEVTHNNNDDKLRASAFVTHYLKDNKDSNVTMIATHVYSWIPKYVFQLDQNYIIPEDINLIESSPKINSSLLVVDRTFKNIMSGNDDIGEGLRKAYSANAKNKTTTVEVGSYEIILPKVHSFSDGLILNNMTNLLSTEYKWKLTGSGRLSHVDGSLNISVKTNDTNKASGNAVVRPQLTNMNKFPLILLLSYVSKTSGGIDNFSMEIRDHDTQKRYLKGILQNTSGNETSKLFILPTEIIGRQSEFRFGISTNTPGNHTLMLKKVSIVDKL